MGKSATVTVEVTEGFPSDQYGWLVPLVMVFIVIAMVGAYLIRRGKRA